MGVGPEGAGGGAGRRLVGGVEAREDLDRAGSRGATVAAGEAPKCAGNVASSPKKERCSSASDKMAAELGLLQISDQRSEPCGEPRG